LRRSEVCVIPRTPRDGYFHDISRHCVDVTRRVCFRVAARRFEKFRRRGDATKARVIWIIARLVDARRQPCREPKFLAAHAVSQAGPLSGQFFGLT
jgi:hypothetical protein